MQDEHIVSTARGWLGTPYRHQASCRGAGTDCLGLILGVWRETLGQLPEAVPPYTADWSEAGGREDLLQAAMRWLVPADAAQPGDVLLFRMRDGAVAKHLGIATDPAPAARFIHAYSGHAVVETALSEPWARRLAARFRFPERA
ncbi:NlpC/P60 family protein [Fuscibacter oryzae]|uniref:C40 family peptidase n=1 Tax=Fuscibacter oryzae TaxID=2803939 RepID=A0A8J7MRI1_9RHOB|nr:NlpC/P60 family protein [Fuscibacter oryzae]MBL4927550.1 C40 family peptidase [Fuscibacter oryzae]